MRLPILGLAFAALAAASPAAAQTIPAGDPAEDFLRVWSLLDSSQARSFAIGGLTPSTQHLEPSPFLLLPLTLRLFANSAYPWGQNDGALWRGKGVTAAVDGGVELRWRSVTLTVRPLLAYQQNSAFALAPDTVRTGYSSYGYPYHRGKIDMPQRFGGAAFWTLDPGQTSLRLTGGRLMVGLGTENLWWGPARRNSIVMSTNAAGFPHALVGTSRPLSIGIGAIEAQWVWGRLHESDWFDTTLANDRRYFTGLVGTFQPQPFPGLYLGGTRAFMQYYPTDGLGLGDYFLVLQGITKKSQADSANPVGDDARDQMLSVFARWAPPGSGFEAYAEWARNDHNWDMRDFLVEPEHSQAYTLGFQYAVPRPGGRVLRLQGELTRLERPSTFAVREAPPYYTHHLVTQGYTQRGQVIGAGVGPGGNSQFLGVDLFTPRGKLGAGLIRQVRDNDVIYERYNFGNRIDSAGVVAFQKHDVTLGLLLDAALYRGPWTIAGELALLKNYNRYYLFENDVGNVGLGLTVRRHFRVSSPAGTAPASAAPTPPEAGCRGSHPGPE